MELCDACGFEYAAPARSELARRLTAAVDRLGDRLVEAPDDLLRRRSAVGVWSPLEYACHVRDVLDVQAARTDLALREERPTFAPMGREQLAIERCYNEQRLDTTVDEIARQAGRLARQWTGLGTAEWARVGVYNYPSVQERAIEWIARHTLHEVVHHTRDVQTQLVLLDQAR